MTKLDTLEAIDKAKNSHIKQMEKIEAVLNGASVENPTTVSKMKCDFGQWLYGEDREMLEHILGTLFYNELDEAHEDWHKGYAKIHALIFHEQPKGFFTKLFNNKVDPLNIDKAKIYFMELEQVTKKLLGILEKSKRRMSALNESKFI